MASNVYKLSVRRGPEEGQTFPLSSSSVTVGRDPMAEIVFSDPEVSRQHARFTRTEDGYQLQDLGSTNGTFVEGKRLGGEIVPLTAGTVITMGSNVTVVFEAAPDPMATVISPDAGFGFEEEDEPQAEADDMRTMIESAEPADDIFPGFDEGYEEDDDVMGGDSDATSLEYPGASEPQPLVTEEDDADDAFSFDFDEADYGEPVAPRGDVAPNERTVLDMEASDFSPYASQPREEDSLPSFDDSSELPSFDDEPAYKAKSPAESPGRIPPPPPAPPAKQEGDPNRRRNMIIAVVAILLLCCCCSVLMYFVLGDPLLELLQPYLQF